MRCAYLLDLPGVEGAGVNLVEGAIGGGVLKVVVLRSAHECMSATGGLDPVRRIVQDLYRQKLSAPES